MKRLLLTLAVLALVTPALMAAAYYLLTKPMAVRAALPLRAVVTMDEYYWDAGMLPDFLHCVRAKVSEAEFRQFVQKMKLVPYHGGGEFPACEDGASWWNPSSSTAHSFTRAGSANPGRDLMAKYENGMLYYFAQH